MINKTERDIIRRYIISDEYNRKILRGEEVSPYVAMWVVPDLPFLTELANDIAVRHGFINISHLLKIWQLDMDLII